MVKMLPLQGGGFQVQFLVGKLRSHMPCSQKRKKFFFSKMCLYCGKKKKKKDKKVYLVRLQKLRLPIRSQTFL